ncbi:hypothetical protein BDZ91DRAFT_724097 [Kalaharituber pfeilii]|nr:hypothetical protein BDZ91DRAFT_724097 [Kalaharituber pfeilii]
MREMRRLKQQSYDRRFPPQRCNTASESMYIVWSSASTLQLNGAITSAMVLIHTVTIGISDVRSSERLVIC